MLKQLDVWSFKFEVGRLSLSKKLIWNSYLLCIIYIVSRFAFSIFIPPSLKFTYPKPALLQLAKTNFFSSFLLSNDSCPLNFLKSKKKNFLILSFSARRFPLLFRILDSDPSLVFSHLSLS
jgi:hypothetical protein